MKILFISSFFPPYEYGGYEIRIKNIVDNLLKKNHHVVVISTKPGKTKKRELNKINYVVIRKLHYISLQMDFIEKMTTYKLTHKLGVILAVGRQILRDIRDLNLINRVVDRFHPDLIYLGQILPLTRTLLPYLSKIDIPTILDDGGATLPLVNEDRGVWYRLTDPTTYNKNNLRRAFIHLLVFLVGIFSHQLITEHWYWPKRFNVIFRREVNLAVAKALDIPLSSTSVLTSGVDVDQFTFIRKNNINYPLTIILPARIEPRKGHSDALNLIAKINACGIEADLLFVGESQSPFINQLNLEIDTLHVGDHVKIFPMLPQTDLVQLLHKADLCFFPSYWKDGFSRVPLEAMACGCLVISYGNEGSREIIRHRENGFLVDPQNYDEIICIIKELASNDYLYKSISVQARQDIERSYSLTYYIDQIESYLHSVA